jgi:hypothetical protein
MGDLMGPLEAQMAHGELTAGVTMVAAKEGIHALEREKWPAVNKSQQGQLETAGPVGPEVSIFQKDFFFQDVACKVLLLKLGGGRVNKHTRFYSDDSNISDFSDSLEDISANHGLRLLHNRR